jgi:hypothetical protein
MGHPLPWIQAPAPPNVRFAPKRANFCAAPNVAKGIIGHDGLNLGSADIECQLGRDHHNKVTYVPSESERIDLK